MLNRLKQTVSSWSTFAANKPFVSVFIICGTIVGAMFLVFAVGDKVSADNPIVSHAWLRTLLHLGFGGILARSFFFGLTQLQNNISKELDYRILFGTPVLFVFLIAINQEFLFPGDFFRDNIDWKEKYKSFLDIATWTISAAYAIWTLYRNCDLAYAAKLQYLSKRKRETIDK